MTKLPPSLAERSPISLSVSTRSGCHPPVTEPVHVPKPWAREASMTDIALPGSIEPARRRGPDLDRSFHPASGIIFMGVIAAALLFVAYSIYADVDATGAPVTNYAPFILLLVALLIALGFEFVNGF